MSALIGAGAGARADIVIANDSIEVRLDEASGAIRQAFDRLHGIPLVASPGLSPALRVNTPAGTILAQGDVLATPDPTFDGTAYDLTWSTADANLVVHARVEAPRGDDAVRFLSRVDNSGSGRVHWIEYPVIGGVGALGADPARTELIHPVGTGYRLVDPWRHVAANDRLGFYPDGYGGASLQLLAYLERGVGGFDFRIEDASGAAKRLDAYLNGSWMEIVFRFYSTNVSGGQDLVAPGPVVLAASRTGEWEDSADRYRDWALTQPWATLGPLRARPDTQKSRWLLEQTGVTTFGISVRRDQSAWFTGLSDFLAVPLFHVSGFWWPGGMIGTEWYGGYNDWSLDRVSAANLDAIRAANDRFALFLFPQHFSRGAWEYSNPATDPASDPVAPWSPHAMSPDPESGDWSFMCPATPQWQDFYGWRAVTLMNRRHPDAEYLDIGPGLGRVRCESASHNHAPGWGTPLVAGAQAMLDSRRSELHAIAGAYVPRGTEMISELYLDRFDFYQARANAGPLTMLEGDHYRAAELAGWAEKIPLFDFVYHDYAPVRLDGNLKLAPELGDLFYWVAARVALWGGLPELNYELSALERLPGMKGSTYFETYRPDYDCRDITPYSAERARGDFLEELADLRTRRGIDELIYGRMRKSPVFASAIPTAALSWRLYNTFNREFSCAGGTESGPEYHSQGTFTVPVVLGAGWSSPVAGAPTEGTRRPVEKVGLVLAEVGGGVRNIDLVLDPERQGVPLLNFQARVLRRSREDNLGLRHAGAVETVRLASREAVLVRLEPAPCTGPACRYRVYRAPAPLGLYDDESLLAEVTGHSYADDALHDGRTWFYTVDDGGGQPRDSLRITKGAAIELAW